MLAILASAIVALAGPAGGYHPRVWVGPMPFVQERSFRADYLSTLLDGRRWPESLARARVFKSYLMVLPADPVPPKRAPEASDEQLRALATFCRQHRLKVAFEVGGIRMGPDTPNDQAGEYTAAGELPHLRRWLGVGGRIDYLTTDHAVMLAVGAPYVAPATNRHRGMTVQQAIEELTDYFEIMHREIPTARFGVIESLGFFRVDAPNGRRFDRTVPALPIWPFAGYLDELLASMRLRGLALDHFHIDFGYEGVHFDGGGKLDCGRILAVERAVQSRGVRAGVIVNAFHDQQAPHPDPAAATTQARANTLAFVEAYVAQGGRSDEVVVQTWQPYPDRTGPESDPNTVLGLARDVLKRVPR